VVIINPRGAAGWLEESAMDGARRSILRRLRGADRNGRLGVYQPVTVGGEPIYVHAKVLVIDDRLLRIGSSNLNNRSMGFDTECDVAVEAPADAHRSATVRERIVGLRNDLLAEHLGVTPAAVSAALATPARSSARSKRCADRKGGRCYGSTRSHPATRNSCWRTSACSIRSGPAKQSGG